MSDHTLTKEHTETNQAQQPEAEKDGGKRKPLGLKISAPPQPDGKAETHIRQSLSHGRSKTVTVEVRQRRLRSTSSEHKGGIDGSKLTQEEQSLRFKAVHEALQQQLHEQEAKKEQEAKAAEEALLLAQQELEKAAEAQHSVAESPAHLETEAALASPSPASLSEYEAEAAPITTPKRREEETSKRGAKSSVVEGGRAENRKRGAAADNPRKKLDLTQEAPKLERDIFTTEEKRPVIGLKKLRRRSSSRHAIPSSVGVRTIFIPPHITVQDLALQMAQKVHVLIKALQRLGEVGVSPQHVLSEETAEYLVRDLGHEAVLIKNVDREKELWEAESGNGAEDAQRAPIVTVMGHVDHGKTSLLDALRRTTVARGEAGGITQHIGAYQVHLPSGKRITFIDTPGHKAFSGMRLRGAQATDIVVLVVAADDGINTQTIEAISHAQAAGVAMVVAINKIDKPEARPDRIREQLLSHNIVVEKLGGDVLDVEISATTGKNLDKLEEAILLQAELLNLRAPITGPARGVILETQMKKGHGPVATVLVQRGSLRVGDHFVAGSTGGRVRLLFDDAGRPVKEAGPSTPVELCGLNALPKPGDRLMVLDSEAKVKEFLSWKADQQTSASGEAPSDLAPAELTLDKLLSRNHKEECSVVIKADVQGSLEGIQHELSTILHNEVELKIVQQGLGPVSENDILVAKAAKAFVLAFDVAVLPAAKVQAERDHVEILHEKVVYHAIDKIKDRMSALLKPEVREDHLGTATVLQLFVLSRGKISHVAGCMVKSGLIRRGEKLRILRDGKIIHTETIESLHQGKNEMKEIKSGYECGIGIRDFKDIRAGDTVECFSTHIIKRTL